jgi:hypothetical protein
MKGKLSLFGLLLVASLIFGCTQTVGTSSPSQLQTNKSSQAQTTKNVTACSFRVPGFVCFSYKLGSNGVLMLDLGQGTADDIRVIGFNCTVSTTWNENDFDVSKDVTIPTGSHAMLNGTCWKADGTAVSGSDIGKYYTENMYIHYLDIQTNLDHKIVGNIIVRVE